MHTDKERYIKLKVHVHIYSKLGNTPQDVISRCTQIKSELVPEAVARQGCAEGEKQNTSAS